MIDRDQDYGPTGTLVATHFGRGDPREQLRKRMMTPGPDGWVMVRADELRAVIEMRVCRAAQIFERDEDGPMAPMRAHCVLQAGHRGDHSNGYYRWP